MAKFKTEKSYSKKKLDWALSLTSSFSLGGVPVCLMWLLKSQHNQVLSETLFVGVEHRSASIRLWQRIRISLRAKTDLFKPQIQDVLCNSGL